MHVLRVKGHLISGKHLKIALSVAAVLSIIVIGIVSVRIAMAAPTPNVSFTDIDTAPMIGEETAFRLRFDNSGDQVGYGPYVDLLLPEDFSSPSVTYLGNTVNVQSVGSFPTGTETCHDHPLAKQDDGTPVQVCLTPATETTLYVMQLLFGSFTDSQTAADLQVTTTVAGDASLTDPQSISAKGGFYLGEDPLNNPTSDPSIVGSFQTRNDIQPTVLKLRKQYISTTTDAANDTEAYLKNEYEIVPGDNHKQRFRITADVASGHTVTDLVLRDILPTPLLRIAEVDITPATGLANTSTGNTAELTWGSITGTASDNDARFDIVFEVPYKDSDDAITWPQSISNTATADANYEGTALPQLERQIRDGNGNGAVRQLHIKPMITQKTVSPTGARTPGDVLTYTVRMHLSDYIALNNMQVTDTLPDGMTYQSGSAMLTLPGSPTAAIADPTSMPGENDTNVLVFDLSGNTLRGGCVPVGGSGVDDPDCDSENNERTIVTLTFQAQINETYTSGATVLQGHHLNNRVATTADILSPHDLVTVQGAVSDDSNAEVRITQGSASKTIYQVARSGSVVPMPYTGLQPGDEVTYRLQYTLPNSDFNSLVLRDYLPLPMFSNVEVGTSSFDTTVDAIAPAAGQAKYGPNETLYDYTSTAPTITHEGGNTLAFTWPSSSDNNNTARSVDILFTVTIGDQPYAPGMFITNQATATEDNGENAVATSTQIHSIAMEVPEPRIRKGVVASDRTPTPTYMPTAATPTGITFVTGDTPSFTGGNISSGNIAGTLDSNISGIDAGDKITYAITIENTGKGQAYKAALRDTLPAGIANPENVQVRDGTGTLVAYSGDLFGAGLEITDPIAAHHISSGENILVITYDATVQSTAELSVAHKNTAQLTHFYASQDSTANYVAGQQGAYEDKATAELLAPTVTKSLATEGRAVNDGSSNTNPRAVIGEKITYTVEIDVPEGVWSGARLRDNYLVACMAEHKIESITADAGVSATANGGDWDAIASSATVTTTGTGGGAQYRLEVDFGDVTNSSSSNDMAEKITVVYSTVLANNGSCTQNGTRTNTAQLYRNTSEAVSPQAQSTFRVVEPGVTIGKQFRNAADTAGVPSTVDANDVVTVRLNIGTLTNQGTTATERPPAYDVTLEDLINPSIFEYVGGSLTHVSGVAPNGGTLIFDGSDNKIKGTWSQLNRTATSVITFQLRIKDAVAAGQTLNNTANIAWTSIPGTPDNSGYTSTGANPLTERSYSGNSPANFSISNFDSLVKSITSTSEAQTTGDNVAIGEIVRYRLTMRVPEGTTNNVVVRDVLPLGLQYMGEPRAALVGTNNGQLTSSTTSAAFVAGNDPNVTPTTAITAAVTEQQVDFNLGTITNTDDDADNEYVVIEFNALVRNKNGATDINFRGDDIINQFTVRQGGVQVAVSNQVTATVQEPNVAVAKSVAQVPVDAGDTVTYQITVTNPTVVNGQTGYDLAFNDLLNVHLGNAAVGNVNAPGYATVSANVTNDAGRDRVTVNISQLQPNDQVTFTITATVRDTAPASYVVPNTGEVTTTSLPGANGTTSNPTDQSTPGTTDAANGERRYSTSDDADTSLGNPSISKAGPTEGSAAAIGATVTYPITITVPQGVTQNVVVTDLLPDGLAYLSHSTDTSTLPSGSTVSQPQASWRIQPTSSPGTSGEDAIFNLGTISVPGDGAQNASFTITVVARVLDILENERGDVLTNTASITYANPNVGTPTLTVTSNQRTVEIQEPELELTKELGGTNPRIVGNTLNYVITVENMGNAPAHEWSIVDVLPPHTSVTSQPSCSIDSTPITTTTTGTTTITTRPDPATAHVLTAGADMTCAYQLTIQPTAVAGSTYTNTAHATWRSVPNAGNPDSRSGTSSTDTASFTMVGADFTKAVNRTSAAIGEVVAYTLTVNAPNGVVQNLIVEDVLPAGLEFVSTTSITNASPVTPSVSTPNNGSVPVTTTWDFGTITHNGQPIVITYQTRVANVASNQNGVALNNTASVQFTPQGATAVTETDTANIAVREPVLVIDKSSNRTDARYGQEVEYTLTIQHDAASAWDAYDVVVTDTLPSGMTLVAGSVITPAGWGVSETPTGFTATRSTLAQAADTQTITYRATVNTPPSAPAVGASLTNDARLAWTSIAGTNAYERTGAGDVNDYTADDDATITTQAINLKITKSTTSTSIRPGQQITYDLLVENTGNATATDIVVTETVPAHTTYAGTGWTCENSGVAGSACTYAIASLASGADQSVSFTVAVDEYVDIAHGADEIHNTTSVAASSASGVETTMTDNVDDITVPLELADIAVTKTDSVDPVFINHDYEYTITVTNNGPSDATNVAVRDELPDGVSFRGVSDSDGVDYCTETAGVINCLIPMLADGDSVVITLEVTGDTPGVVTNVVTARADQQDPNRENNHDEEETVIDPADLEIKKTADKSSVSFGNNITYTLTVTNHGPDHSTDTTVTDVLPGGLKIISATATQGSCITSSQSVRCNVGTLDDGASTVVTVVTQANQLGSLTNQANVSSNEYDPNPDNNTAEVSILVLPLAPDTGVGRVVYGGVAVLLVTVLTAFGIMMHRSRRLLK